MKYWVYKDSRILGPFDKDSVAGLPGVDASTLVCAGESAAAMEGDWRPAGDVSDLAAMPLDRGAAWPTDDLSSTYGILDKLQLETSGLIADDDFPGAAEDLFQDPTMRAGFGGLLDPRPAADEAELRRAKDRASELTVQLELLYKRVAELEAGQTNLVHRLAEKELQLRSKLGPAYAPEPAAAAPPPPAAPAASAAAPAPAVEPPPPAAPGADWAPPAAGGAFPSFPSFGAPGSAPPKPPAPSPSLFAPPAPPPAPPAAPPVPPAPAAPPPVDWAAPPPPAVVPSAPPPPAAAAEPVPETPAVSPPPKKALFEKKTFKTVPTVKAFRVVGPDAAPASPAPDASLPAAAPAFPPAPEMPAFAPAPVPSPVSLEPVLAAAPPPPPPPPPPAPAAAPEPFLAAPPLSAPPVPAFEALTENVPPATFSGAQTPSPSSMPPATLSFGSPSSVEPAAEMPSFSSPLGNDMSGAPSTEEALARLAKPAPAPATKAPRPPRSNKAFLIGAGVLVVVMAAVGALFLRHPKELKQMTELDDGRARLGAEPTDDAARPPLVKPKMAAPPAEPVAPVPDAAETARAASQAKLDAAVAAVKEFPLDGERGSVGQWLQFSYSASPDAGKETWSASETADKTYLVEYRFLPARGGDEVHYLFEVDMERGFVIGKNLDAKSVLAGGPRVDAEKPKPKAKPRKPARHKTPRRSAEAAAPKEVPLLPLPDEGALRPPAEDDGAFNSDTVNSGL